jgi:hypothetical protein
MKTFRSLPLALLTAGLLTMPHGQAATTSDEEAIKLARSVTEALAMSVEKP